MYINAVLLAMILIVPNQHPHVTLPATQINKLVEAESGTHSFQYHQFLLLRHNGSVVAIYATPNPRFGKAGIIYQWIHFPDGSKTLTNKADWENDNPAVSFGTGCTNDGITCRNTYPMYYFGTIETEAFTVKWKSNDKNSGALHFVKNNDAIEVYPLQFERIDDVFGHLDPEQWRSVFGDAPKLESKRP